MRVLCCGDRNWTDRATIERELRTFPGDTVVIEGEARGADALAREVALALGFTVLAYPAHWQEYGRAAGAIRNREMLQQNPELVLAFHNDIEHSKGTKDMVAIAQRASVPTRVIVSTVL
jgi:hypothetical protein